MSRKNAHAKTAGMSLQLDWIDAKAARYACEKWHYSKTFPNGKLVKIGVWEDGEFIGAIVYGHGASAKLGSPYGLTQQECCELVRVALRKHRAQVSRILAISFKMLRKSFPGVRLIVSFADATVGHHGGIYQASNWIFAGETSPSVRWRDPSGKLWHSRRVSKTKQVGKRQIDERWTSESQSGKYRYLMPLDEEMRRQIEHLSKPYPNRVTSTDSGVPDNQSGGGGASPTVTLSKQPQE